MGFLKKGKERARIEDAVAVGHIVFMKHIGMEPDMDALQLAGGTALEQYDAGATLDDAVEIGQWVTWAALRFKYREHQDSPFWKMLDEKAEELFPRHEVRLRSSVVGRNPEMWAGLTQRGTQSDA